MPAFEKYQWLSACSGIEIHIQPGNSYSLRYCSVSLEGESLNITEKKEWQAKEGLGFSKLDKSKPVALTITGKGILIKKVPKVEELGPSQLNQHFPNLKAEEFYAQNFISGSHSYIAIARKELVDEILAQARQGGLNVLLISLGPFAVSHALKQLNSYNGKVVFNGHIIQYSKEYIWESYKYEEGASGEFPLKIGIEPMKEQMMLAYAVAFQLALYNRLDAVELNVEEFRLRLEGFSENQKFRFRLAILLAGAFLLLLINFLLFSHYNAENEELGLRLSQTSSDTENFEKQNQQIAKKESLLNELGWYKGHSLAFLAGQIGKSKPRGITLSEVLLNPLNVTESNRRKKEIYETGKILVRGEVKELSALNEWIYILKETDLFRQVNLNSFSPSTEGEFRSFELSLSY